MGISLTKKELAEIAGYSRMRLHQIEETLEEDKKLFVKGEDGKYDLALFVQRWVEYNKAQCAEETEELSKIKAKHEAVKKQKTEIEVKRLKGEFVSVQEVRRAWGDIAAVVANRFVNLPRKLAPALIMLDDADAIEAIIDRDVREALSMIADTPLPGDAGRTAADGSTEDDDE